MAQVKTRISIERHFFLILTLLKCLVNSSPGILNFLYPKTRHMFYFTAQKQTAPNCPVKLVANFNPGTGSQSYQRSDNKCSRPARYRLPFFLRDLGPRYNAISVAAHEGRPGHHTQVKVLIKIKGEAARCSAHHDAVKNPQ